MSHHTVDVDALIERYDLEPHPEGGYYAEIYRSDLAIPTSVLPDNYGGERDAATSIVYLLPVGEKSAWHRVRSDELWLHQAGRPLNLRIGSEPEDDHPSVDIHRVGIGESAKPQVLVPAGKWQSAEPEPNPDGFNESAGWSLVACVVVPGFHPDDFELAE